MTRSLSIATFVVLASCESSPPASTPPVVAAPSPLEGDGIMLPRPWTDEALLAQTERYLTDAPFRRSVMEASLTNKDNVYSLTRISGYGLEGRGWEMLPEWTPKTHAIDDELATELQSGAELVLPEGADFIWDGTRPENMSEWIALGRKVFFEYPLRSEVFAEHALRSKDLADRIGLFADANGVWPGVVAFQTLDGETEIGITCALCHVSYEHGEVVEGRARRSFDYGEMRLAYYRDTGADLDENVRERMARWGPGRADITQDDDEDPVAIVDLWGIRNHEYLTQSGTLRQVHPAVLAIRQETQLLHANQERVRPPRELAWALALYVYSLTPPRRAAVAPTTAAAVGKELFTEHCGHCHRDENYGGLPVSADSIGTDPMLARGSARGTGLYRPAPLTRVIDAAPYFHDGTVGDLAAVLDPERKVPGHRYGTTLPESEREALIAFMKTL